MTAHIKPLPVVDDPSNGRDSVSLYKQIFSLSANLNNVKML